MKFIFRKRTEMTDDNLKLNDGYIRILDVIKKAKENEND